MHWFRTRNPYHLEENEQFEFFSIAYAAFHRAIRAVGGATERFYEIGGFTIRLCFAGEALIPLVTPALEHLRTKPKTSPNLTICLWDRASTGARMTLLSTFFRYMSWDWQGNVGARFELKSFSSARVRAAFHPGPNILSLLDIQEDLALYWVENADQIVWFETGSPLQKIFHWWMSRHEHQFLHAGAVGALDGGILLVGKGGSGKSTTSLACLQSDLQYAGDDYCLAAAAPPRVYSLYNTAKLKGPEDLARFPHLMNRVYNPERAEDEKIMLFLHDHYPEKIVKGFPLKAVLVPQVSGKSETVLTPASPGLALGALAPSTIAQLPDSGQAELERMSQLVRQIPCYALEVGTELHHIPDVISKVLSGA